MFIKKILKSNLLFALLFVVTISGCQAKELTQDNCVDFLEMGSANYTIIVQTGAIDWSDTAETTDEYQADVKRLTVELRSSPDDISVRSELIDLYKKSGNYDEANRLAKNGIVSYRKSYERSPNQETALEYSHALSAIGGNTNNDKAYELLIPYIEDGSADAEVYKAAINYRSSALDYERAFLIADLYIEKYPNAADPYYQKFSITFTANIVENVMRIISGSLSAFLNHHNEEEINDENIEGFVKQYLNDISNSIDFDSLDKAIEFDPGNYEYNLAGGTFKSWVNFYSTLMTASIAPDVDSNKILDLFSQTDQEIFSEILPYLETAEKLRPENDIQVFLAYALYYLSFGEFENAQKYANLAINTRPDLPEGYDALIMASAFQLLAENTEDVFEEEVLQIIETTIIQKLENVGPNVYDYAVLATINLSKIKTADESEKMQHLKSAKTMIDNSLNEEPSNALGLVGLGNYYTISGDYAAAIAEYNKVNIIAEPDYEIFVYNNRGVANALAGNEPAAIADLNQALDIIEDNENSLAALEALGER